MIKITSFLLFVLILLTTITPTAAQESIQITAEVIYPSLTVYAVPTPNAPEVGELVQGDVLVVLQREGNYQGLWVRATAPAKNITGWVDTAYLYFADAGWKRHISVLYGNDMRSPAYVENDTLPLPLESQTVYCGGSYTKVRAEPFWEAAVVTLLDLGTPVTVTGNAWVNGSFSVFVRALDPATGIEGWIYSQCIGTFYEHVIGWRNVNLPVITFTSALPVVENPISELPAVMLRSAYLRPYPATYYVRPSLTFIPAGTALQIIGRHSEDCTSERYCWYQVDFAGMRGWVWGVHLRLDGDYNRLPFTG